MPRTTSWVMDTKRFFQIEHKLMYHIPLTPYERILKRKYDNEINMTLAINKSKLRVK